MTLTLLGKLLVVIGAAGVAWWLIGYATEYVGEKLTGLARGLVVIFALAYVCLALWRVVA